MQRLCTGNACRPTPSGVVVPTHDAETVVCAWGERVDRSAAVDCPFTSQGSIHLWLSNELTDVV